MTKILGKMEDNKAAQITSAIRAMQPNRPQEQPLTLPQKPSPNTTGTNQTQNPESTPSEGSSPTALDSETSPEASADTTTDNAQGSQDGNPQDSTASESSQSNQSDQGNQGTTPATPSSYQIPGGGDSLL